MARAMLIQSAWTSCACATPATAQAMGRGRSQGRNKRIAVVALARKLAGVLWAMWRDGTVYDPKTEAQAAAHGVRVAARQHERRADALERAARKLRREPKMLAPAKSPKRRKTSQEIAM